MKTKTDVVSKHIFNDSNNSDTTVVVFVNMINKILTLKTLEVRVTVFAVRSQ